MRPPDPDRQVELVELLATLDVAESLSRDDPIAMYVREVASVEPLSLNMERELLAAVRRGDEAVRLKLTEPNLWEVVRIARQFLGLWSIASRSRAGLQPWLDSSGFRDPFRGGSVWRAT